MKFPKNKILTTGLGVTLAAALVLGGGTYAYLQSQTEDVVNNFKANKVMVTLTETKGDQYNIIPGTRQEKDPTVTVDATVDSYVYVRVMESSKLAGLVRYDLAEGWKLLEGYTNIYYREVTASDTKQTFPVLLDNQVSYDAALENIDMLKGPTSTQLISPQKLTFTAFAIQKAPFNDPVRAFSMQGTEKAIQILLDEGKDIIIANDISNIDNDGNLYAASKGASTLDLNGKTLKAVEGVTETDKNGIEYVILVANEGTVLTIDGDGTVIGGSGSTSASKINNAIRVRNGGKCIINSGTFTTGADGNGNPNSVIYVRRTTSRQPGAEVVINGGFFYNDTCDANGNNWLLNIEDDDIDVCKITVYGGTFVNFNPADTNTEKEGKDNFVAEGYHVEQKKQENGDIWYTVFPDAAGE